MDSKKAVIIGSGIAGMAAAIRLAVLGFEVVVYESNNYPGGKLSVIEKDGYRFDAGPSLFTQPQHIEDLFKLAGEPISEYFQYEKLDVTCRYFFENNKVIDAFSDASLFAEELSNQANEKENPLKNYLTRSGQLYNRVAGIFLNNSLHKRKTWLNKNVLKALAAIKIPYLFSTLDKYNRKNLSSPEAARIFNRFATYNGSDPFKAPAMLSVIPHLEYNQGVFYPRGGMISITKSLYALALKKGVRFVFNALVKSIIHNEGKAVGIVVNDENIYAPVVVSNVDAYLTFKNLLNHLPRAKKILKQERSSSALIFYWGIKKTFPRLQLHNIFFSDHYREEFNAIFDQKTISADPTVYINVTSKMDPDHAPSNTENWFVMINAPANYGQDWQELARVTRANVIEKISRILQTDIKSLIETEQILDPVMLETRTGSYMGSLYGSSSNSRLAAFFRPPNFTNYIRGLYFCGGSVHPGGGIPLCLNSAKIVATLVENDQKKTAH